jgi:amino acid adenylation domain-containing protein
MNKFSYQLSPMQQGMLFEHLKYEGAGMNIEQMICSLHEALNVLTFTQAWQRVVERHPILRSSFDWQDLDEPLQTVHPQVQLPLEQQDWRYLSASEQEDKLQAYLQADRERGFDLIRAPLIRLALFQLAESDYKLVWTFHHILLEGRSLQILLKEVFAFYEAFCQGEDLQLEQPRPYSDYIEWLQQQDVSKAEAFWRQMLSGFTAPTPLVVERVARRGHSQELGHGQEQLQFSETVTSALKSLAQEHELTLNTLVNGAWALLLSRYSGEEDVVFGATRACRRSALQGAESMVGLFINTLPLRVQVSPELSVLSWLKELRSQWIALRDYEHTPLVQVQKWSDISPGISLFQSIVVFENYQLNSVLYEQGESWKKREFQLLEQTSFPLTVSGYAGQQLLINIEYHYQCFEQATIMRMLGHLQTLLESMVANPEQRLADLPILTQAERHQLLVEWNNTTVKYLQYDCIHQLIEQQVQRTPEAIAVVWENQKLTYQELNTQANHIAHYLRSLGVQPEVKVGICIERCLEMIVGILAIIKAGGAYLPLDPAYPPERLEFMLRDARVPFILTKSTLVETLPHHQAQVICLDTDKSIFTQQSSENPSHQTQPHNLAYIIYTSGSTGKPKGITIEHRSLINAYLAWEDAYHLSSRTSSHLQMASFSFDVFSGDLVRTLCSGGKLAICPKDFLLDPRELYTLMQQQKIDCAEFVPAVLRNLIQYLEATNQNLGFMKLLVAGSDSWYLSEYQHIRSLCGHETRLINSYGVSEATIDTTYFETEIVDLSFDRLTPIGRPFANNQVYLLDDNMQPVPIGVPGELYIGGAGLARGYLNRPDLTEEKFIPHPFADYFPHNQDKRLYKTNDKARYLADGNIEFLGRLDNQVKIRGFRIELGEIEILVNQHPQIKESIVIIREDVLGDKRIVAYIVSHREQTPAISELRQFLKKQLPDYMVPSAFVMLEAIPLTPNGKVDRQALPLPEAGRESEDTLVAPRNELERELTKIWERVLGIQPIGIRDNFFSLGGHSLIAVQLFVAIEKIWGRNLPLGTLFQAQTIEELAKVLRDREWSAPWSSLVLIQPGGLQPPLFCIHPIGGNILEYYALANYLDREQPIYGLQSQGLDGKQQPFRRVEEMASHYLSEIRTVQPHGPYFLLGYSFGGLVAFEMARQLAAAGEKTQMLALIDRSVSNLRNRRPSLLQSWKIHLFNLWQLNLKERSNYIMDRITYRLTNNNERDFLDKSLYKSQALTPQLSNVLDANLQASEDYITHSYNGKITLFRCQVQDLDQHLHPDLGWSDVVKGNLEIYHIPGSHLMMMKEPRVRRLAEKVRFCLQSLQLEAN